MEEAAEARQVGRYASDLPAPTAELTNTLVQTNILIENQQRDDCSEELYFPIDQTPMSAQPPEFDLSLPSQLDEDVMALNVVGESQMPILLTGEGENAYLKFQLIPISETPGKGAVGEVAERKLVAGDVMKIGRMVMRDGQATIKGTKAATEIDVWFQSKVVSRLHAEIWAKDGQLCIKDVGSSSGTFLNKMRLSPTGKESRPYPLKQGDILQFGVDFKGKAEVDIYRAIVMKVGFHDQAWLQAQRKNANPKRFTSALKSLLAATNPYGDKGRVEVDEAGNVDCCICIAKMAPFQALFIAPCSHCYHYKCVAYLITQSPMFQCPLCRQVANLTASVSSDSLNVGENGQKIIEPLPILLAELEPEVTPKKPITKSIFENLGLRRLSRNEKGEVATNPFFGPPTEEEAAMTNIQEKKTKRTFSMKLKSLIGGKPNVDKLEENNPSNTIPRVEGDLPAEYEVGPSNSISNDSQQENKFNSESKAKTSAQ